MAGALVEGIEEFTAVVFAVVNHRVVLFIFLSLAIGVFHASLLVAGALVECFEEFTAVVFAVVNYVTAVGNVGALAVGAADRNGISCLLLLLHAFLRGRLLLLLLLLLLLQRCRR